ncbi:hypothetical protein ACET3Z_005926 [Daucus carota]
MLVTATDGEEKPQGDASGESILSGFESSCGSSSDEAFDQEEFIAELTRRMAENMLQEDEEKLAISQPKPSQFHLQNIQQGKKSRQQMKESGNGSNRAKFLSSTLQNGSGMKVVFLGQTGLKNGSSGGTGVFIPHATNNLPDPQPRKKPGRCPTVLVPERVLHTLKQHFEKRTSNQAHPNGVFHTNQNQRVANNNVSNYQDLQLPQEWTY